MALRINIDLDGQAAWFQRRVGKTCTNCGLQLMTEDALIGDVNPIAIAFCFENDTENTFYCIVAQNESLSSFRPYIYVGHKLNQVFCDGSGMKLVFSNGTIFGSINYGTKQI